MRKKKCESLFFSCCYVGCNAFLLQYHGQKTILVDTTGDGRGREEGMRGGGKGEREREGVTCLAPALANITVHVLVSSCK